MANANVKLQFEDVLGGPLDESDILIEFFSLDNSQHFRVVAPLNGAAPINVSLTDPGNDIYRVMITPVNYRVIQFFLRIAEEQTTTRPPIVLPVDPAKVADIDGPRFDDLPSPLKDFLSNASLADFAAGPGVPPRQGSALYDTLSPLLKAALLNLFTKSSATTLVDDTTVFSKLGVMIKLKQDRLFAKTGAALLEETMQDTFFHHADDTLHETIPPYQIFTSFKTRDSQGNLQLTFSRTGNTGDDYLVDMDIDEAKGIGHIFEVLKNLVTSGLTNPYDVREILAADQGLTPLYTFRFAARGVAKASATA